jgi:Fe-S cluster assembly ATP-binding protein
MTAALEVTNLHVNIGENRILKGIDLHVKQGEIHALMGPNGSGKSTLAYPGRPSRPMKPTAGQAIFGGEDLLEMEADERSRAGLFLAFQYPVGAGRHPGQIPAPDHQLAPPGRKPRRRGHFCPRIPPSAERKDGHFGHRPQVCGPLPERRVSLAVKRSGPRFCKWRCVEPKIAIMDETDSGLDIDALRVVSEGAVRLHERTTWACWSLPTTSAF